MSLGPSVSFDLVVATDPVRVVDAAPSGASGLAIAVREAADAARVRDAGSIVVARADAEDGPFRLAHGDGFGAAIEELEADLALVRLAWNTHDDPDAKRVAALDLTRLVAWLHGTGRGLVIDLDVPPADEDLDRVDGDGARYASEVRPDRTRVVIVELRDLGVEPDVWSLAPPVDADDAAATAAAARDAGRDEVRLLVRVTDPETPPAEGWDGVLVDADDLDDLGAGLARLADHGAAGPGPA